MQFSISYENNIYEIGGASCSREFPFASIHRGTTSYRHHIGSHSLFVPSALPASKTHTHKKREERKKTEHTAYGLYNMHKA